MNNTLSEHKKARIEKAIAECDAFISWESKYPESTRTAAQKTLLDFYVSHRAKLIEMLG